MLDTKTAIEANAATSRSISVMRVSCPLYVFILFSSCSNVNPKKTVQPGGTIHRAEDLQAEDGTRSDFEFDDLAVHEGHAAIHAPGDLVVVGGDHRERPTGVPALRGRRRRSSPFRDRDCRSARRPTAPGARWQPHGRSPRAAVRRRRVRRGGGRRDDRRAYSRAVVWRVRRLRLGQPRDQLRHHDVFQRGNSGRRWWNW